jgi:hypothetical protein
LVFCSRKGAKDFYCLAATRSRSEFEVAGLALRGFDL